MPEHRSAGLKIDAIYNDRRVPLYIAPHGSAGQVCSPKSMPPRTSQSDYIVMYGAVRYAARILRSMHRRDNVHTSAQIYGRSIV